MIQLNVTVNLSISYDEDTKTCTVSDQIVQVQTPSAPAPVMEHQLGVAEIRYGILTLGTKSVIGRIIPRDADITVVFGGNQYPAHSHKTSGGRIDRLSSLMRHFVVTTVLDLEYDANAKELRILSASRTRV